MMQMTGLHASRTLNVPHNYQGIMQLTYQGEVDTAIKQNRMRQKLMHAS